jgi:hypothetical protein
MLVKPILTAKGCGATTTCHAAGGTPPELTTYDKLPASARTPPGTTARIVAKGMHEGPALDTAQAKTIADWVDSLPK